MTSTASFHQKNLLNVDVSINPGIKMTYPGPLMWDRSLKIHNFIDFLQPICWRLWMLQQNDYKTDLYLHQNFQSNTTVCLIIHAFCKICIREIGFVLIFRTTNNFRFTTLTKHVNNQTICGIALEKPNQRFISQML